RIRRAGIGREARNVHTRYLVGNVFLPRKCVREVDAVGGTVPLVGGQADAGVQTIVAEGEEAFVDQRGCGSVGPADGARLFRTVLDDRVKIEVGAERRGVVI